MSLMDLLLQAASGAVAKQDDHFSQVANQAPPELLGRGISEAFRSDQTPPFPQMLSQLFGQSNASQQAGVLNQIIRAIGPMAAAGLASGALQKMLASGANQVTPAQASQLTPQQVQEIAQAAEKQQPGIVDQLGSFYAEHPTLVKTLGSAALMLAMLKMNDAVRERNGG
jgi:hypothetical protein